MTRPVRAALLLVLLLGACGGSATAESPLAHRVEHLEEHGFDVKEVAPEGDPTPEAMAVRVQREGVNVYVGRASEGGKLPATNFEDVVFTSEEEH